jgi:hypothetical protein
MAGPVPLRCAIPQKHHQIDIQVVELLDFQEITAGNPPGGKMLS